jgi:competence protein ComEC
MRSSLLLFALAACARTAPPTATAGPAAERDETTMRVHLIDVGQGAATLVELPCGALLVDTGGERNDLFHSEHALAEYLERFFARRTDLRRGIDLLVLTHPHLDHTRNAQLVAERYVVRGVVTDGRTKGSGHRQQAWLEDWARSHARYETAVAERIPSGGATSNVIDPLQCAEVDPRIRVLWGGVGEKPAAWSGKAYDNANNHSVLVRVDFGRASFLVSGDLEEAGIGAVLAKHAGSGALDVDVWEVSHHGSYNGTTNDWLAALTPHVALISVGPPAREAPWTAWEFGHPRKPAIERLLAAVDHPRPPSDVSIGTAVHTFETLRLDKAIYATGWDGDVVVTASSAGEYRVTTGRR